MKLNSNNIVFRVDCSSQTGMGHLVRCIALAEMLKETFTIYFALQEPSQSIISKFIHVANHIIILPVTRDYKLDAENLIKQTSNDDTIVLDGYFFDADYQLKIKNSGYKLVCIDDLISWHQFADVVINHAEGIDESRYLKEEHTNLYLGLKYVMLRNAFLKIKQNVSNNTIITKVFISMGAADITNLTYRYTKTLLQIKTIEEVHLMVSSVNPHINSIEELIKINSNKKIICHFDISDNELVDLLKRVDLAICPASNVSLECCAVGVNLISGLTADNQAQLLNTLIKFNTIVNFGNLNELEESIILERIKKLINSPLVFEELRLNQKQMIDGDSPSRILNIFKELSTSKLSFRFATAEDADLYYEWANDELVRANSYNQDKIEYTGHVDWFNRKLKSIYCRFYLFFNNKKEPVGQVRIDKQGDEVIIGISIDSKHRGNSYGVEMLKKASANYLHYFSEAEIIAYIKCENNASYRIFIDAGFRNEEIVDMNGFKSYKLHKSTSCS